METFRAPGVSLLWKPSGLQTLPFYGKILCPKRFPYRKLFGPQAFLIYGIFPETGHAAARPDGTELGMLWGAALHDGGQCLEESPQFLSESGLGTRVKNLFLKNRFFR